MKCPKCGSKKLAPILYGMPAFDEEMKRKLDNKQLVLGGCCITGADPQFHCFGCGKDVCKPPVLRSKQGVEDYRDIVTSIKFVYSPYLDLPFMDLIIKKRSEGIHLKAFSSDGRVEREVTTSEWKKLLNSLYGKLYLHEWKKRYEDVLVFDGDYWELKIKLTNGRVREYSGSNDYPPYWKELLTAFKPLLKKA